MEKQEVRCSLLN